MLQIFFLLPGSEEVGAIRDARDFDRHVDRERFRAFAHALFDEGVYLSPSASLHSVLATVHAKRDVVRVVEATRAALGRV
jgi:glutamate-1-semialdehyde aminotransferase